MKISFICTIFNEEKTIEKLLLSLTLQTKFPDEVIIVDGGSTDNTISNIKFQISNFKGNDIWKKVTFKLLIKKGNRSVGRNYAIKQAKGDVIVCTDAGCMLDNKWVENITQPFKDKTIDVVAGYYQSKPKTVLEQCVIPYVFVMPDKVDPNNFLPATRSMAFRKTIWKRVGGFPEKYSHNEDYVFARKLKKINAKILFKKNAIVYWIPPRSIKKIFIMFFRFAFGDAEAGIWRPKVLFLLGRYCIGIGALLIALDTRNGRLLGLLIVLFCGYIIWSIMKNYKYIKKTQALILLPLLQFISDIAIILGTIIGEVKYITYKY